jgi:hypothetical protein
MSWFSNFFGSKDAEQRERTDRVSAYVHAKKNKYTSEMLNIHNQSKKVHDKARQTQQEAVKLKEMVDDVAYKIAISTGGIRRGG